MSLPENPAIKISTDKLGNTITITDHGTGMSKEELADHLGTIARSGTAAFTLLPRRKKAGRPPQPHRPVRRRLLLRLHGG